MNPVGKALWFIESHFARELTLDDITNCGCVSRFHLARAFEAATGLSVMRYVRGQNGFR
jgi:AraC family transcriptional regulator